MRPGWYHLIRSTLAAKTPFGGEKRKINCAEKVMKKLFS